MLRQALATVAAQAPATNAKDPMLLRLAEHLAVDYMAELNRVAADDIIAFIDLAGLGPGQYSLTVHADSLPDVGVTRVEPASVQVRITSGKH